MSITVYLTFDDGIQAGTAEVLEILDEMDVRGTFFLTGLHTHYLYRRSPGRCLQMLKQIYERHIAGNHSYSHAHDYYSSYYSKGLLIDNDGGRRTVPEDMLLNEISIGDHLRKLGMDLSRRNVFSGGQDRVRGLARLPGRNVWSHRRTESDAQAAVDELVGLGYEVFGWDEEWRMSFDLYSESISIKSASMAASGIDFRNHDHTHPDHDMYDAAHLGKDRLTESGGAVVQRMLDAGRQKLVLLLHDRAFRDGAPGPIPSASMLADLVRRLKKEGAVFQTLDQY